MGGDPAWTRKRLASCGLLHPLREGCRVGVRCASVWCARGTCRRCCVRYAMSSSGGSTGFAWPFFYSYPPYFTKQPVRETADKQSALWGSLILAYCRHHKLYVLSPSEDIPLWNNADINRHLPTDAATAFLDDLVAAGSALWLDAPGTTKSRCLVLWRRLPDVAAAIADWAATFGVTDSVMLLDELTTGPEVAGTELEGLHREVLLRALQLLEAQGRVRLFRGSTPEEEGVKFL